jgi:hypothetical protein
MFPIKYVLVGRAVPPPGDNQGCACLVDEDAVSLVNYAEREGTRLGVFVCVCVCGGVIGLIGVVVIGVIG